MKAKKIIIIMSILAIASILAYLIFRRKKVIAGDNTAAIDEGQPATSTTTGKQDDYIYPWKIGTSGPNVMGIQRGLNQAYDAGLNEDGVFGPKTQAALLRYLEILTIKSYDNRIQIIQILKNKIKSRKP